MELLVNLYKTAVFFISTDVLLSSNSDSKLPTEKAIRAYVASYFAAQDAFTIKGSLDCSTNPNYPSADAGHVYKVFAAGKIGGASGASVSQGDLLVCFTDNSVSGNHATVGSNWIIIRTNLNGTVFGPGSSTAGNFVSFLDTSGVSIQDSGLTYSTDTTFSSNSDSKLPTEKAIRTYVSNNPLGCVVGPIVSVAGNIPVFGNTSGKLISDSGVSISTDGTMSANSDLKLPTEKAVRTYLANYIAAQDVMVFKGTINCSTNPNYPAADAGYVYRVSVAGRIGGPSGPNVEQGDTLICTVDSTSTGTHAIVGANWTIVQNNIDGAVIGPISSTDNAIAVFDGTSGKSIKASSISAILDSEIGSTIGNLVVRGPSGWVSLPPGSIGQVLTSTGSSSVPTYQTLSASLPARIAMPVVVLTDANTITIDASTGNSFRVVLAGNRVLANPQSLADGQQFFIRVKQDVVGNRTLSYGTKFKFVGGIVPVLSTTPGYIDILCCQYDAIDDVIVTVFNKNFL